MSHWSELADRDAVARHDERLAPVEGFHDSPAVIPQLTLSDLPLHHLSVAHALREEDCACGTASDVIKVLEQYSSPQRLKKRTPEQMAEAFEQIKENYTTSSISKVISASSSAIVVVMTERDGDEVWWTFAFEPGEQVRFAGISGKIPES